MLRRAPGPLLRPFVTVLWASEQSAAASAAPRADREHVLPTGAMHVVFRLSEPLRIYDRLDDLTGRVVGSAIVGGPRSSHYVRDVSRPATSVGVQLRPGASSLLFDVPAGELAERHTSLDALWGRHTEELRERLAELPTAEQRLDLFEAFLTARAPRVRGVNPAIASALGRFAATPTQTVRAVANELGYGERRFLDVFRDAVGLSPKAYARVMRFDRALARLAADRARPIEVAIASGYSDQPHFNREFLALAGITPGQYLRALPKDARHVPAPSRV